MPAKRKNVAFNEEPPPKRSTPGVATPQSLDSDDDYDEDDNLTEAACDAVSKFSASGRTKRSGDKGAVEKKNKFNITGSAGLQLKPDHKNRPLFIDPDTAHIILESFHPLRQYASDFLTSIAEPLSRPTHIHEYALTTHSLYTAMSVGLTVNDIFNGLNRFLKTPLPEKIIAFVKESTSQYGRVKLVLKHNEYYLETSDAGILQQLLSNPEIQTLGLEAGSMTTEAAPATGATIIPGTSDAAGMKQAVNPDKSSHDERPRSAGSDTSSNANAKEGDELMEALRAEDDDDDEDEQLHIHSLKVPKNNVEELTRLCLVMGFPLLEEYDFRNDDVNPKLEIDLKPGTKIRDYQEKSLGKMFGNGRARSGIIVLPCGAGKTLVGVTAACTIRRSVVVLCNSEMSVVQWKKEFESWSNINPEDIALFTAGNKNKFPRKAGIIICTYQIIGFKGKRAHDTAKMLEFLTSREWGLMILDEVHIAPANVFRKVGSTVSSHCKLGLTATLLREDDKITDLNFLVGPKLYEANWMELSNQGHIARVQCAEVWCPMTAEFYQEYLREKTKKRGLLYIMNPRKLQACQYLINHHEARGDKIIVFSDNVYALEHYALKLKKPYIFGETSQKERQQILDNFRFNEQVNTIFLSKIGDTSLDLPEATCLIQISSHYSSRRQEAQRLGRILRAKRRNDEGFNAFFYSLVSKDTDEMRYSSKRQAFLVDQGYAFKVVTHLKGIDEFKDLAYTTAREQRELLQEVLLANEDKADVENVGGQLAYAAHRGPAKRKTVRRAAGTLSDLSGGQDMAYIEYNRSRNKELKKKGKNVMDQLKNAQNREKRAIKDMMTK